MLSLCFTAPADAIRAVADSVGREARRELIGHVVRVWVEDIPEEALGEHYAKALAGLGEDGLQRLAEWHGSLAGGRPIANSDFLAGVFPGLGANRREALKCAATFRGEEAFDAGVTEEQALRSVLPHLSRGLMAELAQECLKLYVRDRLGGEN
jgi:hypothetical protein